MSENRVPFFGIVLSSKPGAASHYSTAKPACRGLPSGTFACCGRLVCQVRTMENTMRLLMVATLLAGTLAGSSAFAQGSYVHHKFCLKTSSSQDCAYDTMAQCEASKRGNADSCVPNSAPQNH